MAEKTGLERLTDQQLSNGAELAFQFRDWETYEHFQEEIGRRVTAGPRPDPNPEEEKVSDG